MCVCVCANRDLSYMNESTLKIYLMLQCCADGGGWHGWVTKMMMVYKYNGDGMKMK